MEANGTKLNFMILDACRDNPLTSGTRIATRGLGRIDAEQGSILPMPEKHFDVEPIVKSLSLLSEIIKAYSTLFFWNE